jgi:hypothetical protein
MPEPILVAKAESEIFLPPQFANRHRLIASAAGLGEMFHSALIALSFHHSAPTTTQ